MTVMYSRSRSKGFSFIVDPNASVLMREFSLRNSVGTFRSLNIVDE